MKRSFSGLIPPSCKRWLLIKKGKGVFLQSRNFSYTILFLINPRLIIHFEDLKISLGSNSPFFVWIYMIKSVLCARKFIH
jgi:hypothetical protein